MTAETGEGAVEDYVNHPLNLLKSACLAQILRGLTGIFRVFGVESLNLAVFDVLSGVMSLIKPKAVPVPPEPARY